MTDIKLQRIAIELNLIKEKKTRKIITMKKISQLTIIMKFRITIGKEK